jgi:hypothetical protein
MSTSRHHERSQTGPHAPDDRQAGEVSRRTMLAGAVATAATVGASDIPAYARGTSPDSREDMMAFLVLSAALTGIRVGILAPEFVQNKANLLGSDPGTDPINVKNDYFKWVNASNASTFEKLLQIARDHSASAPEKIRPEIISEVNAHDDTKFLARSIVLLWYLGSWYKPEDLKSSLTPDPKAPPAPIPSQVVSAKAYTQGLVWQIAQTHPMGYSNLQFGYWSRDPVDPNDTNLPLITPTIP